MFPVFVIGSPRSGTTLLTRLMNRFLDIHVSRDAGVFLRFRTLLPMYGDLADRRNVERLVRDLYADREFQARLLERGVTLTAETLLRTLQQPTFAAIVDRIFSDSARNHGKSRWGNKKPSYALNMGDLDDLFPEARFVHIVRDGRDVVLSMRATSRQMFDKSWYHAALSWRAHVRAGRRQGETLGPRRYLEIRYEELLSRPVPVFGRLVGFIGDSPANRHGLATFERQAPELLKPGNFEKWRGVMPRRALKVVEQAAGDALQALGYGVEHPELVGRPFSPLARGWFLADNLQRKVLSRSLFRYVKTRYSRGAAATRASSGR